MPPKSEEKLTDNLVRVPMSDSMVKAVDDYRFEHRHPSQAAAIRALVEIALNAVNKLSRKNQS